MFEPRHGYPGTCEHTASYYAATRNDTTERPSLKGRLDTDVCIVGAGYSGLSTALHLAEKGCDVTLVEGARVGWGASGRNGGQIVNGLNAGLDRVEKRFGAAVAECVGSIMQEGGRIIREWVQRYAIRCDLKDGNLFAACTAKQMHELEARDALWRRHGMQDHELLDRSALSAHVGSDVYVGAMLDRSGGHLHPLNLALGEAAALESLGGTVYERTLVKRVDDLRARPIVHTDKGEVHCRTLVLCGNAYLGNVVPELASRVMPVSTQIIATAPLAEDTARALLPTDYCVEDLRYILDYFRLTDDRRLLFGGGSVYGGADPADVRAKLVPAMERVYPQLRGVAVDYAWSGNFALSFTRVPQMGRLGPNTYFAHGYSGHGVTGSHLFGRILAEAISGDVSRFDVFARLPWVPFPGGRLLRAPYSTLGSWWYGLRDRLGI